uniref:Antimicrobial peptide scolopin-1 n=1 Tax=Scolopendra mutilans TaxID=2836329 RepID=AMP1_SCOMU|nr:RecName: Full=Antimicrobial peptide scolopin-1 [Scolopendra mutilans]
FLPKMSTKLRVPYRRGTKDYH